MLGIEEHPVGIEAECRACGRAVIDRHGPGGCLTELHRQQVDTLLSTVRFAPQRQARGETHQHRSGILVQQPAGIRAADGDRIEGIAARDRLQPQANRLGPLKDIVDYGNQLDQHPLGRVGNRDGVAGRRSEGPQHRPIHPPQHTGVVHPRGGRSRQRKRHIQRLPAGRRVVAIDKITQRHLAILGGIFQTRRLFSRKVAADPDTISTRGSVNHVGQRHLGGCLQTGLISAVRTERQNHRFVVFGDGIKQRLDGHIHRAVGPPGRNDEVAGQRLIVGAVGRRPSNRVLHGQLPAIAADHVEGDLPRLPFGGARSAGPERNHGAIGVVVDGDRGAPLQAHTVGIVERSQRQIDGFVLLAAAIVDWIDHDSRRRLTGGNHHLSIQPAEIRSIRGGPRHPVIDRQGTGGRTSPPYQDQACVTSLSRRLRRRGIDRLDRHHGGVIVRHCQTGRSILAADRVRGAGHQRHRQLFVRFDDGVVDRCQRKGDERLPRRNGDRGRQAGEIGRRVGGSAVFQLHHKWLIERGSQPRDCQRRRISPFTAETIAGHQRDAGQAVRGRTVTSQCHRGPRAGGTRRHRRRDGGDSATHVTDRQRHRDVLCRRLTEHAGEGFSGTGHAIAKSPVVDHLVAVDVEHVGREGHLPKSPHRRGRGGQHHAGSDIVGEGALLVGHVEVVSLLIEHGEVTLASGNLQRLPSTDPPILKIPGGLGGQVDHPVVSQQHGRLLQLPGLQRTEFQCVGGGGGLVQDPHELILGNDLSQSVSLTDHLPTTVDAKQPIDSRTGILQQIGVVDPLEVHLAVHPEHVEQVVSRAHPVEFAAILRLGAAPGDRAGMPLPHGVPRLMHQDMVSPPRNPDTVAPSPGGTRPQGCVDPYDPHVVIRRIEAHPGRLGLRGVLDHRQPILAGGRVELVQPLVGERQRDQRGVGGRE